MGALKQLFLLSLLVTFSKGKTKTTTSTISLESLSSVDLEGAGFDGDILFDLSWPGSEAKQQGLQSSMSGKDGDESLEVGVVKVLPSTLVSESYSASETVTMTTVDHEKYTCLLPDLSGGSNSKDSEDGMAEATPQRLLQALSGFCTRLLMGYWSYELCHSRFVRQYHEEQVEKGKMKVDEYFLGKAKPAATTTDQEREEEESDREADNESTEKPPMFYYNGKSYAYYEIEMDQGTVCDISNEPRSIHIKYICDLDSHQSGTLLHIAEVTTCKYEAVVSTQHLCNNKHFRMKENPRHAINCYPEGDAPRRPTVLLEHELSLNQFYPKSSKGSKQGQGFMPGDQLYDDMDPQERFEKQMSKGLPPDEQFLTSFLSGESCLRGGAGWWLHEICYGKYVRQVHEDNKRRVDVYLGHWNEAEHRAWFERTGKRKQSKTHVTHLYTNGDVCDVTGTPRTCQVKFKCVKTSKTSQVTIFLEEPSTCSYTLTVEATFLCPLLESTNEIGLIQLSDTATLQTEPPVDAPPTDAPPTIDPHDPDEATKSHRGIYENKRERIHSSSDKPRSHSSSNQPESHSSSKNEPLQSHSGTHGPQSHSSSTDSPHRYSKEGISDQPSSSADSHSHSDKPRTPNQDPDYADSANKQPNQERGHDKSNKFPLEPPVTPKPPVEEEERRSGYHTGRDLTNSEARDENIEAEKSGGVPPRMRNEQRKVVDNSFGDNDSDFEDDERSERKSTRDKKDSTSHA